MPRYEHDCDACCFVGTFTMLTGKEPRTYDGYVCAGSYIARSGDDGPDYESMPISLYQQFRARMATSPLRLVEIGEQIYRETGEPMRGME